MILMVFAYYKNLSRVNQAIYRKSDRIEIFPIGNIEFLRIGVSELRQRLEAGDRQATQKVATELINQIAKNIKMPLVSIRVLSSRPATEVEELHGLYEPIDENSRARITVWMRTAKHKKVVAFRSFLRTLLHELCHHIDYELLLFDESFHTEGFFKREAHMFRQLMDEEQTQI